MTQILQPDNILIAVLAAPDAAWDWTLVTSIASFRSIHQNKAFNFPLNMRILSGRVDLSINDVLANPEFDWDFEILTKTRPFHEIVLYVTMPWVWNKLHTNTQWPCMYTFTARNPIERQAYDLLMLVHDKVNWEELSRVVSQRFVNFCDDQENCAFTQKWDRTVIGQQREQTRPVCRIANQRTYDAIKEAIRAVDTNPDKQHRFVTPNVLRPNNEDERLISFAEMYQSSTDEQQFWHDKGCPF